MPIEEKQKVAPVERPIEVEKAPEAPKEAPIAERDERAPVGEAPTPSPAQTPPAAEFQSGKPPPLPKEPLLVEIESLLEEDLAEVYVDLPDELKPKFKAKGEEVARTIRQMISQAKVKARRVLKLIRQWLTIIPGVNRFFLEQETAIKTQKILAIAKEQKAK